MGEKVEQEYEVSFMEVLLALKEKLAVIISITLFSVVLGGLVTFFFIEPQYEASINMIVNAKTDVKGNITTDNIYSSQNLVDTYAIIIKSNSVLLEVIDNLNLEMSYEELYEKVSVESVNNTQIMKISVKSVDANEAVKIAEEISKTAPEKVVEAVEAGSCKVVSQVEKKNDPVSPNYKLNMAIAGVVGLCLCMGFFVLKELLYDYITDDVDVEKKIGISVLGIIPYIEEK